jgi:hypothetical protein
MFQRSPFSPGGVSLAVDWAITNSSRGWNRVVPERSSGHDTAGLLLRLFTLLFHGIRPFTRIRVGAFADQRHFQSRIAEHDVIPTDAVATVGGD